jgi:hypothetical protein
VHCHQRAFLDTWLAGMVELVVEHAHLGPIKSAMNKRIEEMSHG